MNHQLANKRALVTGGSRGIGATIVKRLADEDVHVAFTYISKPELRGVAIFAKACFGHPSPIKRQKLNATAHARGCPAVLLP
jgi:NAD(P)-dependent dehydrogenase (short-subunit alcohol dehydrogenase family)